MWQLREYRVGTGGRIHPETACGDWLGLKKCDLSFNLPPGFYPPSQPSITSHLKIKFRAFVIQWQQRIRKSRRVWLFRVQRGTWMCNCSVYRLKKYFLLPSLSFPRSKCLWVFSHQGYCKVLVSFSVCTGVNLLSTLIIYSLSFFCFFFILLGLYLVAIIIIMIVFIIIMLVKLVKREEHVW